MTPDEILRKAQALRESMTPENCHRLADETVTALEQARAAVAAHGTEETRAALAEACANAHALILAVNPDMIEAGDVKFALLEAAMNRLDQLRLWIDPLLEPDRQKD